MKKLKKVLLGTEVFLAAFNFVGCVYGPPPDEVFDEQNSEASMTESAAEDDQNTKETVNNGD